MVLISFGPTAVPFGNVMSELAKRSVTGKGLRGPGPAEQYGSMR